MGLCLAKPFAPASVLGAWMLGHGPDRTESLVVGAGRRKNKRTLCSLCVRLFTEFGINWDKGVTFMFYSNLVCDLLFWK